MKQHVLYLNGNNADDPKRLNHHKLPIFLRFRSTVYVHVFGMAKLVYKIST